MDYANENTGDWKSKIQFVTSFITGSQNTMQTEIMSHFNVKFNELNDQVKAVDNVEQDHFDLSRNIKKTVETLLLNL